MSVEYKVVNPATGSRREASTRPPPTTRSQTAIGRRTRRTGPGGTTPRPSARRSCTGSPTLYAERADELAAIITREMGKTTAEAVGEIEFVVEHLPLLRRPGPDPARRRAARRPRHGGQRLVRKSADRPAARDHAVELPVLPGRPVRRPEPDGRATRSCSSTRRSAPSRRWPWSRSSARPGCTPDAYINLFATQRAGRRHHRRPAGAPGSR